MKKLIMAVLAGALCAVLAACGPDEGKTPHPSPAPAPSAPQN